VFHIPGELFDQYTASYGEPGLFISTSILKTWQMSSALSSKFINLSFHIP